MKHFLLLRFFGLSLLAVLFFTQSLNAQGIVSGRITKENGVPIGQAEVHIAYSGQTDTVLTDGNGGYSAFVPVAGPITITPSKYGPPGGHLNGVTLADTSVMLQHILGLQPLASPYLLIAADVDQSFSVSTFDAVLLAEIINGVDSAAFFNDAWWIYFETSFIFPNPPNPFGNPSNAMGFIQINDLNGFSPNNDFIAVKMGDLNLDAEGGGASDLSQIQGTVRADENADCLNDTSETDLKGWLVRATGSNNVVYNTLTDNNGYYQFYLLPDGYTVEAVEPNYAWALCIGTANVVLDQAEIETVDFAAGINQECTALSISLSTPFLRRCFPSAYTVYYHNDGTIAAEGAYVEITLDSLLVFNNSSIPWSAVNGLTYTFPLGDVAIGSSAFFNIGVTVSCDAVLGQTHCSVATILPESTCEDPSALQLDVQVECANGQVVFQVENTGADMTQSLEYVIIEDIMIETVWGGSLQLNGGQTQNITIPANGSTWRFEIWLANELLASAAIEGCGGFQSLGFINQFPLNDNRPDIDVDCRENIGAYDPNDKQGFPLGVDEEHWVPTGQRMEYLIRFQNTGTDTAFTVLLRDTLSDLLDLATLSMGAGSHAYDYRIVQPNVLEFLFANIMLPDSNVNEPASNGFVRFSVAPRAGLPNGTVIHNSAAIYFDFNEPIITNTTKHTFGEQYLSVNIFETPDNLLEVKVWPNPAADKVTFHLCATEQQGIFRLYNSLGIQVQEQRFTQSMFEVPVRQQPSGSYVYRIEDENGTLMGMGKIVIYTD